MATGTIKKPTFRKTATYTYTKNNVTLTFVLKRIDDVVFCTVNSSSQMNISKAWTQAVSSVDEDFIPQYDSRGGLSTIGGVFGIAVPFSNTAIETSTSGTYFSRGSLLIFGNGTNSWIQGSGFYLINAS